MNDYLIPVKKELVPETSNSKIPDEILLVQALFSALESDSEIPRLRELLRANPTLVNHEYHTHEWPYIGSLLCYAVISQNLEVVKL